MPARTADLIMTIFTDGRPGDRTVTTDLVIDELDSWMNPNASMAIPTIWSKISVAPQRAVAAR